MVPGGGWMLPSRARMLKVAAGLVAAAMVALLLDWYSPSRPAAQQLLQTRSFAPEPAPGAEADNLFWLVQVSPGCVSKGNLASVPQQREAKRCWSVAVRDWGTSSALGFSSSSPQAGLKRSSLNPLSSVRINAC